MGRQRIIIANDFTAFSVALPTIEREFDTDVGTVQWVINAYALMFGVLIVDRRPPGRHVRPPADLLRRRGDLRLFLGARRAAPDRDLADRDARLMGIGGAMMWPAILGMTFAILPEDKAGLAGGLIIGAAGLGNAVGPMIGGVLTDGAQLALDLLRQRADRGFAVARGLSLAIHQHGAGGRRISGSTTRGSRRSRSGSSRC